MDDITTTTDVQPGAQWRLADGSLPPMAGGDPLGDAPVADAAVADAPAGEPAGAEGQGAAGGGGLYPSLDFIPDEALRTQVGDVFKQWDGNVQKEFGKRAEALKAWEPYDQLGLRDFDPQDLERLIAFSQMDDDSFKAWVTAQAQELGLTEAQVEAAVEAGEDPAATAGAETQDKPLTADDVQRILEEREQARQTEVQQQEAIKAAAAEIDEELSTLAKDAGIGDLDDEAKDVVFMFASKHQGPDDIKQGFAQYMQLLGKSEKQVLQEKLDQPVTPEKGGRADATVKKPASFEEAQALTVQALQNANRL